MAELGLAAPKFAVHFTNALAFEPTTEYPVELLAACGQFDNSPAPGENFNTCDERARVWLVDGGMLVTRKESLRQ